MQTSKHGRAKVYKGWIKSKSFYDRARVPIRE